SKDDRTGDIVWWSKDDRTGDIVWWSKDDWATRKRYRIMWSNNDWTFRIRIVNAPRVVEGNASLFDVFCPRVVERSARCVERNASTIRLGLCSFARQCGGCTSSRC